MNATTNPSATLGWSRLPAHYAIPATPSTLAESRQYCARLARTGSPELRNFADSNNLPPFVHRRGFLDD